MDAITVQDVRKTYGDTVALDGLSFRMAAGRLTGFLGPNGAGKTTTFRVLLGLTRADSGTTEVLGMRVGPDTPLIVKHVGAIVEEPGLYKTLSARDNLRVAALTLGRGMEDIEGLLQFVNLDEVADRKVDGFSKGMRQRLALAAAMVGDPDLLILDEPLDGLDPVGQVELKRQLRRLAEERGKTVVVSTHDLTDIERLADDIVVIDRGRTVAQGPVADLLDESGSFVVGVSDLPAAEATLRAAGISVRRDGTKLIVAADDGAEISRVLAGESLYPSELVPDSGNLEDVFLRLTGNDT